MIKAVIFDYGGVVTSGGGGNGIAEQLAPNIGISVEEANRLLKQPWYDLVRGNVTELEFWLRVETNHGRPIPENARNIWNSWEDMKPRTDILNFIEDLKSKGYIVGLLSNVIPRTETFLREEGVYELFSPCVLSCQLGIAKPDVEIYTQMLDLLENVSANQVIYIDDQERCLVPAKELGMKTVLAIESKQIISDVNHILE